MNRYQTLLAMRCALADLEGIMPEFEPSGDRTHPAWKTIEELKDAIRLCEQEKQGKEPAPFTAMVTRTQSVSVRAVNQDEAEDLIGRGLYKVEDEQVEVENVEPGR